MIHKSYLLEQNIKLLDNNIVLFYGENLGLINDLKRKLIENTKIKFLKLTQEEIIKNQNIIYNEININSLVTHFCKLTLKSNKTFWDYFFIFKPKIKNITD